MNESLERLARTIDIRAPRTASPRAAARRRVLIRAPVADDERDFVSAVCASRRLHHPWIAAPDTPERFQAYLARMAPPQHFPFLVCRADGSGELVGVVNVSNVIRGLFQSACLGYYAFAGHSGQGLMREGLQLVVRHAFGVLRLHRLEANVQPGNEPSRALVQACGFACEGFSPRFLKVGGRWRDHERWAILAP